MRSIIAASGHTLITGEAKSWQGLIGHDLAFEHAANGGVVIEIVDREADRHVCQQHTELWCRYRKISPGRLSYRIVAHHPIRDGNSLLKAIEDECLRTDWRKSILIVRDISTHTLPLLPGATWLNIASELSTVLKSPVLTMAHGGHHAAMLPAAKGYSADRVWTCKSGLSLRVELHQSKPADPERKITFKGAERPGLILWEHEPEKELAHV